MSSYLERKLQSLRPQQQHSLPLSPPAYNPQQTYQPSYRQGDQPSPPLQPYGGYGSSLRAGPAPTPLAGAPFSSPLHRELDERLKLEAQKRELELLVRVEEEKQKMVNDRFYDQERKLKDEAFELEGKLHEANSRIEQRKRIIQEIEAQQRKEDSEVAQMVKENTLLKEEMDRLRGITNHKITELQKILNESMREYENEKAKNKKEADARRAANGEKLIRLEDEYKRKVEEWTLRLNQSEEQKRKYRSELSLLKSKYEHCEKEADDKLYEIEQRIKSEEEKKTEFQVKAIEQKLRAAMKTRDEYHRKGESLQRELQDIQSYGQEQLEPIEVRLRDARAEIEKQKEDISINNSSIDQLKMSLNKIENEISRLNTQNASLRQELQKREDTHLRTIREEMDNFNATKKELEYEILSSRKEVEKKEYELKKYEEDYNSLNRDYQRMVDALQTNLTKTIASTIGDLRAPNRRENPF